MTWQFALFLNTVFSTIRSAVQKKIVTSVDPQLTLFYVICFYLTEVFILHVILNRQLPLIYPEALALGMVFAVSTTCLFAAIRISLSQTSLFASYAIIVSMALAAVFLGENRLFNPTTVSGQKIIVGLLCAVVSMWLIAKKGSIKKVLSDKTWLVLMIGYIIFDGIGQFGNKVFLATHQPLETLVSQMIGHLPILYVILKIRKIPFYVRKYDGMWIALDSFAEVGFAVFLLISFKLGPLSLILPIQKLATIIGGMSIGLILFKESYVYTKAKVAGVIIGLVGIVLLIV